jgi:hypothetical protein
MTTQMKNAENYDFKPNLQYQYICFRKMYNSDSRDWIEQIPVLKEQFKDIHCATEHFFARIHLLYLRHYVFKTIDSCNISDKYYNFIYKIHHELYLPSLKTGVCQKIRLHTIKQYFLRKDPRELLYILRGCAAP